MSETNLFVKTPVIESIFTNSHSYRTFLKLENNQPSGSFKTRGISNHCIKLKKLGCRHFVSSSGGNTGLAVAYSGRRLGIPTTVFVPETTPNHVRERMRKEQADVYVRGDVWDEANEHALKFVNERKDEGAALVHPFNHPDIWEGHATMIYELKEQLQTVPDLIILSVGGGGLLVGALQGLHDVGWNDVPVVACETEGADCFHAAVDAGHLVTLPKITSVAKCLGALTVLPEALEWRSKHKIIPRRVSDKQAISACLRFADKHYIIVEPACGASLTTMFDDYLEALVEEGEISKLKTVVVIVCGGQSVKIEDLLNWKKELCL